MEAGRGAFALLSLSSLALMLAAGAAAIFLLRLFEMSDPITLTLQSCWGEADHSVVTSTGRTGAGGEQLIKTS